MPASFNKVFPYSILNGQTNGPVCSSLTYYEDMIALLVQPPAVLAETITFQVNSKSDGSGVWSTLQDDTPSDIPGPVAGKARFYYQLAAAPAWRMVASGNVAAQRDFIISGQWVG